MTQPHGRAWKIHNKDLLIRDIVPKYFVQSKYESFTRQLNGWGFKRLHQSGNDFNAYYHECFLRGMPHLTVLLKRVAPNQGKLLPHAEGEPNFYEIEKQFPLPPHHMVPYMQGYHHPYPPAMGNGYHYAGGIPPPSEVPAARPYPYYPGAYPPQPPYYGQIGDPNAAAAVNQMSGFSPYPTFYSAQYPYPPQYEQYAHSHSSPGHPQGAPVRRDNVVVKSEEESFVPAFQGGTIAPPISEDEQRQSSLEPLNVFKESSDANGPRFE